MPQAPPSSIVSTASRIRLRRLGIDTYQEPVLYMHRDCHVCHSEGFEAQSRVEVALGGRHIVATLNVVSGAFLSPDEAGLSEAAWRLLGARDGDVATLRHPAPLESLGHVRAKVYGRRLTPAAFEAVIADVVAGRYSDLQLAAFVTACAGDGLDLRRDGLADPRHGRRRRAHALERGLVMDKHCVGGLPGNRTTMLIVPIVAACGLRMPKTSSRAITSPAGTADTMETLAPVDLDVAQIRRVVERTGGCIVWGGAVRLSPADDILIRVERPLDLDSQGQLVASVLSKKAAAGATHVLIDMPVGPTAKVRSAHAAASAGTPARTGGPGAGPAGARGADRRPGAGGPRHRSGAGGARRAGGAAPRSRRRRPTWRCARCSWPARCSSSAARRGPGKACALATAVLDDGRAWRKFQEICEAQGGMREPPVARHRQPVPAQRSGSVIAIDNRRLARIAKLAGAPKSPCAGIDLHVQLGDVRRARPAAVHAARRVAAASWPMRWSTRRRRPTPCT